MSPATLIPGLLTAVPNSRLDGVVADFSQETWWLSVLKAVFILLFLIVSVIVAIWAERRVLARVQTRPGPNVNGPLGLPQLIADATKLLLKEDFWLAGAEKFSYMLAPMIAAFSAFMVFAIIPFGPQVSIFGHSTPLQLTDFPVAVLYVLAVSSFGIYGIILGGWSTHSTYPLLGAVRSAAQVISYELSMSLAILSVFVVSGTMSTSGIVDSQQTLWWIIGIAPSFIIYVISMVAEVNRLPFDLPEAEGELVAGHMVEYSSMKFAWYFLGEYINMFNVSAVCTTLFLGGWRSFILASFWPGANEGWWPMLWFIGKVWCLMLFMIVTRGTLVRFRYDHFMAFGWKFLIPVGLVWFAMVSVVQGSRFFTGISFTGIMAVIAGILIVALILMFVIPGGEPEDAREHMLSGDGTLIVPGEEIDAFAGGFPVPPLPGQTLPTSPRQMRREEQLVSHRQITPDVDVQEGTDD
ncbi:NADH-quinone oxidoreductase subunit H [Actinomyces bovis]|uniref:NADH-quinone oxidoreductase subunit H n=1 Tax=Actinomyces bovis TaxID=1658 RepID=A0ABY1VNH5_9ACTO|nr:NADH-quinone oxidoreductase subunit NuoH [Actinomyces bovis]SPT53252.1 NADH-quinone oxidoreductase subunit H [Actinomyces bovis]VEG52519.1 NADH-quinone oxidoreductase subunit H [Actinomyces israelii]